MIQTFELNISIKINIWDYIRTPKPVAFKIHAKFLRKYCSAPDEKKHYHVLTGYKTLIRAWIDAYSNYGKYTLHPVDVVTLGTISGTVYILNFN